MNRCLFPTTPRRVHNVTVLGRHDYSRVIATYHHEPKPFILARVFETFRDDFETASCLIDRKTWAFLAWQYPRELHTLTDPSFDPRLWLAERAGKPIDFVPDGLSSDEVDGLEKTAPALLRSLDPDVSKAVWCILSVVRQLCRTNDVIDEERWWEPLWIADHLPEIPMWIARPHTDSGSPIVSDADLDVPI